MRKKRKDKYVTMPAEFQGVVLKESHRDVYKPSKIRGQQKPRRNAMRRWRKKCMRREWRD